MSYLNALRLHFAGTFQASVSTVNNDSAKFENSTFQPSYQEFATPGDPSSNGWWNPTGDAAWRLIGCGVTAISMPSPAAPAAPAPATPDPVLSCTVADADGRVSAKLADLDPDNQMVSMIFGLQVRIVGQDGTTLLRGDYLPAAFTNIWLRVPGGGGDGAASAMYQSVILNLEWGDVSHSPFLTALQAASAEGLSIKFNVDQYNGDHTTPGFTRGRIVGTIGPAASTEPRHFVTGRQLTATTTSQGFFIPDGRLNFGVAWVDQARGKVLVDLGNSLPTHADGVLIDLRDLTLTCGGLTLGSLPSADYAGDETWYGRTAGVVEWPAGRSLQEDEMAVVLQNPLMLNGPHLAGQPTNSGELPSGQYVRADQFVFRMNPDEGEKDNQVTTRLYATKFGEPAASQVVTVYFFNTNNATKVPLDCAITGPTDVHGMTSLTITAGNPDVLNEKNQLVPQRPFIDGQLFSLALSLPGDNTGPQTGPQNLSDLISILVWSSFPKENPVTWHGSIQPIFQQYENLYPVMKRFMLLGDYDQVVENAGLLIMAFALDPANPNSMPVTRDLSEGKRKAILAWLRAVSEDGKPLLLKGTAPVPKPSAAVAAVAAAAPPHPVRGGKEAFVFRYKANLRLLMGQ